MIRGTTIRLLLIVPLLAAGLALGAPIPAAAATICQDQTLRNVVIKDSLVVKANSHCHMYDVTVRGSVTIEAGGVTESGRLEIRGGLSGVEVGSISIIEGVIRGGVNVSGATDYAQLLEVEVRGDVAITGAGYGGFVLRSIVRGSVTLAGNGLAQVVGNSIGVNLTCTGNGEVDNESNTVGGADNCTTG